MKDHEYGDITVVSQEKARETRQSYSKTRIYGAIDALADKELYESEPYKGRNLSNSNPDDRDALLEWKSWKRRVLANVRPKVLEILYQLVVDEDLDITDELKIEFSQHAGCSCPCSPGFILNAALTKNGKAFDIWIENSEERKKRIQLNEEDKQRREAEKLQKKIDEAIEFLKDEDYVVIHKDELEKYRVS